MEKTLRQPETREHKSAASAEAGTPVVAPDWRTELPTFRSARCTLREIEREDAASLLTQLSPREVSRFVTAPPASVEEFAQSIAKARSGREGGHHACFVVVPAGTADAVGMFQLRSLEGGFATAEWGFAIGSAYWGSGLFVECAAHVLEFAFETVGVLRLEARVALLNGAGNGALRKIGATEEGVLRASLTRQGQRFDQVLWSILAEDWFLNRSVRRSRVH